MRQSVASRDKRSQKLNVVKRVFLHRSILSVLVTLGIMAVMVLTGTTAKALNITFPSVPSSGTLGSAYTFTVKVDVQDTDLLPIQGVDLVIYNAASPTTNTVTYTDLPL